MDIVKFLTKTCLAFFYSFLYIYRNARVFFTCFMSAGYVLMVEV